MGAYWNIGGFTLTFRSRLVPFSHLNSPISEGLRYAGRLHKSPRAQVRTWARQESLEITGSQLAGA